LAAGLGFTRNGVSVGELIPLRQREFVSSDVVVAAFQRAPAIDVERFKADKRRAAPGISTS
jgi:hypothetical protein